MQVNKRKWDCLISWDFATHLVQKLFSLRKFCLDLFCYVEKGEASLWWNNVGTQQVVY